MKKFGKVSQKEWFKFNCGETIGVVLVGTLNPLPRRNQTFVLKRLSQLALNV